MIVSTQIVPITMEKGFDYLLGAEVTLGVGESNLEPEARSPIASADGQSLRRKPTAGNIVSHRVGAPVGAPARSARGGCRSGHGTSRSATNRTRANRANTKCTHTNAATS